MPSVKKLFVIIAIVSWAILPAAVQAADQTCKDQAPCCQKAAGDCVKAGKSGCPGCKADPKAAKKTTKAMAKKAAKKAEKNPAPTR